MYVSQSRYNLAATSSINKIIFGGGQSSSTNFLNTVDILDINTNLSYVFTTPSLPSQSTPPLATPSYLWLSTPFSSVLPVSTQNSSSSYSNANNHNLSSADLIGIIVGSALVVVASGLVVFLILFLKRRKQKKEHKKKQSPEPDITVPSLPSATTVITNSQYVAITSEKPKTFQQQITEDIVVEKELGKGSYGKVCLGRWNDNPVALKFCKEKEGLDDFLKEAGLMVDLPPHPNIVQVFGISIDGPQPILVLEYCAGGSLDKFLFSSTQPLSDEKKIQLVKGIARGMLHLHRHNIIHRDLAARNILLTATGEPKISDFGMSRVLQREDEEGQTKTNIGPIRWMAPESIARRKYSKKSDVWTFGIVVWEIVAQREPHTETDIIDVAVQIRDKGLVPKIPENCPPLLRDVMLLCWKQQPEERPTFKEICHFLGKQK
jgi:predicted Ser/Thr protein kinase